MPRYFFDIDNGQSSTDEVGMVLADHTAVEAAAIKTFFEIGRFEATASHRDAVTITVRNEAGKPIYRATLSMQAGWLIPATTQ